MAAPIDRLKFLYATQGENHVVHAYVVRGTDISGAPAVMYRDASNNLWTLAATAFWDFFRQVQGSDVTGATASFEHFASGVWNPVAFLTLTDGGSIGTLGTLAQQLTAVLRDTNNKKIRLCAMECALPYAGHSNDGSGLGSDVDSFIAGWNGTVVTGDAPYLWQVSVHNDYISTGGSIAGVTFDLNDKLKRRRGLA